jgi:hypothetical protein
MTTVELIRNDNVYRAIGGECWMATYQSEQTHDGDRLISPLVRKVRVVRRVADSQHGVVVTAIRGDSRLLPVNGADLHDDREQAARHAIAKCSELDQRPLPFSNARYVYVRPKPKKVEVEYRARRLDSKNWTVDYRDPESRRWKPVIGLFLLTKWKAADCVKRL